MKPLGEYIERKQRELNLTNAQMADQLNVSSQRLGLYIKGKRNPKSDFYKLWQEVFNEDLETIVSGNETKLDIKNPSGVILENQIEIMAMGRTILSILAEIHAPLKDGFLPAQLANTYRKMVKDEAELIRREQKQR